MCLVRTSGMIQRALLYLYYNKQRHVPVPLFRFYSCIHHWRYQILTDYRRCSLGTMSGKSALQYPFLELDTFKCPKQRKCDGYMSEYRSSNRNLQSAALNFATQHAMPPEFGGKWGTECPNTWILLPTPLCAGYSYILKLIYLFTLSTS